MRLAAGGRGDLNVHGHVEQADEPFDFLRLLHVELHLMRRIVVRVTHAKFRRPGAVNPLMEELIHVDRRGFFDGLLQVIGDHVLAAIDFEIVVKAAEEIIVAELRAQHLQHPAALRVDVAGKLDHVVRIARHDGHSVEAARTRPSALKPATLVLPEFIGGVVRAVIRFGPVVLKIRSEALVQPKIRPVLAGNQIAEPLVRQFVRIEAVRAFAFFGGKFRIHQPLRS